MLGVWPHFLARWDLACRRRSMIDRLMKEAAEEADQKMFCDTEMEKSRAKQKELSSKVS